MDEYKKEMEGYLAGMSLDIEGAELEIKYLACQQGNIKNQIRLRQEALVIKKSKQANAIKRYNEIEG